MSKLSNEEFFSKLNNHPQLLERFKELLRLVEGKGSDEIQLADVAEESIEANLRKLGGELLSDWALIQESKVSANVKSVIKSAKLHSKKNTIGIPSTEK